MYLNENHVISVTYRSPKNLGGELNSTKSISMKAHVHSYSLLQITNENKYTHISYTSRKRSLSIATGCMAIQWVLGVLSPTPSVKLLGHEDYNPPPSCDEVKKIDQYFQSSIQHRDLLLN
jgi:hypothetical protein